MNQRGLTEYGGGVYAIDGWAIVIGTTASLANDGITFSVADAATVTSHLHQRLRRSDLLSGTYTISALYYDENGTLTVSATTFDLTAGEPVDAPNAELVPGWYLDLYGDPTADTNIYYARFVYVGAGATNVKVKAVKLELGSRQTLARQDEEGNWILNDPPPDKNMELLKCCMSTADPNDPYANNRVTPAAINAMNKSGDTMTGLLINCSDGSSGLAAYLGNQYGAYLEAFQNGDYKNRRQLYVGHKNNFADFTQAIRVLDIEDGAVTANIPVLTTGNKPSGSYTGNGSATTRTIETGGIGNVCAVWGNEYMLIVTPVGCIYTYSPQYTHALGDANIKFVNGILTIESSVAFYNASGVTYYYQVL